MMRNQSNFNGVPVSLGSVFFVLDLILKAKKVDTPPNLAVRSHTCLRVETLLMLPRSPGRSDIERMKNGTTELYCGSVKETRRAQRGSAASREFQVFLCASVTNAVSATG